MAEFIFERYNYWVAFVLMMCGLYIVMSQANLIKKIIGINVFQTSALIYYISIGRIVGGTAPILPLHGHSEHDDHAAEILYTNPLPHVLMLTAIVVGVATMAVALALVVRIREAYGTIESDRIARLDTQKSAQASGAAKPETTRQRENYSDG